MIVSERTPVGDIVAKHPRVAGVFERHQIDFCCHGEQALGAACTAAGLPVSAVLDELGTVMAEASAERDWTAATLADLVGYIVSNHHSYLKTELPALEARMAKVLAAHGERHGESLSTLSSLYTGLKAELDSHLQREEVVLFPAIVRYEAARATGDPRPTPPFGTIQNPIRVMVREHESAGEALATMRRVSSQYTVPPDGCNTFRALFDGLSRLEADLHRHIHLENNILFPRAVSLEASFE